MPQFSDSDRTYMRRAIELALKPVSAPHPNPRVGCVVVKNGTIVGEGFHQKAGMKHAEVNALESVEGSVQGGTMYVTLEPCSIYGRTPPCADKVIESGIERLVIGSIDPSPGVNGKGIRKIQNAGLKVDVGLLAKETLDMNKGFFSRLQRKKPWITVKIGATLDGRIASSSGQSKWITSERSREDVQLLRAQASVLLTGIGTVLADDPRLNCRARGAEDTMLRVILDSNLRTPVDSTLFNTKGRVIIFTRQQANQHKLDQLSTLAKVYQVPYAENGLDLVEVMNQLAMLETNYVLVEAGPILVCSLLKAGLVDEVIIYLAPSLLGDSARGLASISGLRNLSERIQLEFADIQRIGTDLRISAFVKN